MGLGALLFTNPVLFFILALLLLYSVIVHEVAHGWVASRFGDDTARQYGRLTLNPLSHLDVMGTLMLFLVGFGWAKPVPVDYRRLRGGRVAFVSVALAGCAANILIASIALLLLQVAAVNTQPVFAALLPIVVRINIILGSFNLIPIPPLDGSKILMSILPREAQVALARIEPYGFFILAVLLYTGRLNPMIMFMQRLVYGFITGMFGFFR